MCAKRYRYKSRPRAVTAALLLFMKMGPPRMNVYRCPECRLWCLTRKGGRR